MKPSLINKIVFPIHLAVVIAITLASSTSALEVHPGATYSNLMSEGQAVSDCNNPIIHGCINDVDLSENWIRAIVYPSIPGYDELSVSIYKDFSVAASSSGNENNLVGSNFYVTIRYAGHLESFGVFQKAGYEIQFYVRDLGTNALIATQSVSDGQVAGTIEVAPPDFIPFPARDFQTASNEERIAMPLSLITGHSYRIVLNLKVEANKFGPDRLAAADFYSPVAANWNSLFDFGGVKWSNLSLTVGTDPFQAIDSLRELLETHTHTYLTGKGEGHNNTEATTSMAVFLDSGEISNEILQTLPEVGDGLEQVTNRSRLFPNYPNPFNPVTTISYTLFQPTNVSIVIYNSLGQEVKKLVSEFQVAGDHDVIFDARELATGVYFYRLITDSFVETRKLILVK